MQLLFIVLPMFCLCTARAKEWGEGDNRGQDRLLSRYLDHPCHVCGIVSGITQILGSAYGRVAAWMAHVEIQVLCEGPAMSP